MRPPPMPGDPVLSSPSTSAAKGSAGIVRTWVSQGAAVMSEGLEAMAHELTPIERELATKSMRTVLDRLENAERGTVRPPAMKGTL